MANTFAPFGFREYGERDGQAPTMGMETFQLASSDTNTYFTGDVVSLSSGQAPGVGFIVQPTSGVAPATPVLGVFVGCEYFNPTTLRNEWHPYFPGSVGSSAIGKAYVITDPERLWIAQGTSVAVLGTSVVGYGIGFTSSAGTPSGLGAQTGGNTFTGISNIALVSSTITSATTAPFRNWPQSRHLRHANRCIPSFLSVSVCTRI